MVREWREEYKGGIYHVIVRENIMYMMNAASYCKSKLLQQ